MKHSSFVAESIERAKSVALLGLAVAVPALCWAISMFVFPHVDTELSWTLPLTASPPKGEHNLAFYRFGPTLRASSFFRHGGSEFHPAFVLDGHAHPSVQEKWTSDANDRHPYLELRWREPRELSRVKIWHAGFAESDFYTVRHYRLRCLRDQQPAVVLEVKDNRSDVAVHALPCAAAKGVRIDWTPNSKEDRMIRIYEIAAWGR